MQLPLFVWMCWAKSIWTCSMLPSREPAGNVEILESGNKILSASSAFACSLYIAYRLATGIFKKSQCPIRFRTSKGTQRSHLKNQNSQSVLLPLLFPLVKMYKNGAGWWLGILGLGGVQTNPSSPFNKKLMLWNLCSQCILYWSRSSWEKA